MHSLFLALSASTASLLSSVPALPVEQKPPPASRTVGNIEGRKAIGD